MRRWMVAVVVVGLLFGGWWWSRRQPDRIEVDLATVQRVATLRAFVTASGEIVATRFADLGSSVMGRLVSLRVREGDRVTAGQVLARIDPVQAESAVASSSAALQALEADAAGAVTQVRAAQAQIDVARSRKAEADRALQRARELSSAGLLPASELDATIANATTAAAQLTAATAALAQAEQAQASAIQRVAQGRALRAGVRDQLAKTEITAPIAGVVTRLDVEEGEMVVMGVQNQPGTILMTISDLSALNAEVKVAEADVLRLSLDNPATVTLDAQEGRSYTGKVAEIGASALPQIGTQSAAREFRVKVRLDGDVSSLRPGLTCDTEILVAERKNVLAVPLQAVVQRAGQSGVFVVTNGRAEFRAVTTGIIGGLTIEVAGVDEGVSIVAGPFQILRDLPSGAAVRSNAATSSPAT